MLNSLNDLQSMLSKKGGVAQPNRFNVLFTPPKSNILKNPIRALTNVITSGASVFNAVHDPREVSILCDTAALPGRSLFTFEHGDVGQQTKYAYTFSDGELRMTFLLTNDYSIKHMFDDWLELIINTDTYVAKYKNEYTADVIIQQLNKVNIPVYAVKLINAFPTSIDAIVLDNSAENSVQKVSVTFAFDKYVKEDLIDTIKSSAASINTVSTVI